MRHVAGMAGGVSCDARCAAGSRSPRHRSVTCQTRRSRLPECQINRLIELDPNALTQNPAMTLFSCVLGRTKWTQLIVFV